LHSHVRLHFTLLPYHTPIKPAEIGNGQHSPSLV